MNEKPDDINYGAIFAAGAASAAYSHGMSEKDAESFVGGICKEAARGRYNFENSDDDTFWGRNKNWLIPAIVGSLAFYVGADAERHGRRDRGYLSNAGHRIFDRLNALFGINYDPLTRSMIETPDPAPPSVIGPVDFKTPSSMEEVYKKQDTMLA